MTQVPLPTTQQLSAVLDNAPVAIYVCALDGLELLYANRLASALFLQAPDLRGLAFRPAGPGGGDPPVREFRHPATGRIYRLSGRLLDWGGRDAHIGYLTDVTGERQEQARAETVLEELQATFSGIPCGLGVYRLEGERLVPLFYNDAFFDLLGYNPEHSAQVRREVGFLGVHPGDLPGLREKLAALVHGGTLLRQTVRIYHDRLGEYRHIRLEGSVKRREDGSVFLYMVYSDVSEQQRLERELADANGKMEDIINAIPGGVAIYRVADILETVYFSDGVPALSGYTTQEYRELIRRDAMEMTYWEDSEMVAARVREVVRTRSVDQFEFRKQHRDGHIVWVRVQVKWMGEQDGLPLLHCVFHNISDLKQAQLEMDHLVNSIPGGIASYRVEGERFLPTFYSDGVMALSGHTREEYERMVANDALDVIYPPDRDRVLAAARVALAGGQVLDVSYRMRHKDGRLVWIHLNGRRMGPPSGNTGFYAVFTGMSEQTRLFQGLANATADSIYVIARDSYDLLYANETKSPLLLGPDCVGRKCYEALHGQAAPCPFCTLDTHRADGEEHEMSADGTGRHFTTRFLETDWNGIPAYVKFVRDVTQEVNTRREKERLEQYFQTLVKNLPGGVGVVRCARDGAMTTEFLSDGFAAATGMAPEEAWRLYRQDALAGVHPDDREATRAKVAAFAASGESHCELTLRLRRGGGGYVWMRSALSRLQDADGACHIYIMYHDVTREREEREALRRQYNELIMKHYSAPDPDILVVGHCNITRNRILEIIDHTGSDLLRTFGSVREAFFTGLAGLVVEEGERRAFLDTYLNAPALAAFRRGDTEQILRCFVQLPLEARGRYVQFKVNLVSAPDTGDVTGILTVTDITEQTISDRILHQLSVTSYDFVVDLDLERDTFTVLTSSGHAGDIPPHGSHSGRTAEMLRAAVVPRDREAYAAALDPAGIRRRLTREGPYTFSYSLTDGRGDIRTKNTTVSAVDLRLGRVCLVRSDITDSVREQQGLLNVIAYTFELMGFINLHSGALSLYTRQTVLENLPPRLIGDYSASVPRFAATYEAEGGAQAVEERFRLDNILARLEASGSGYDFVLPQREGDTLRYKQINVLWGNADHRTVCFVRADVTDMLSAERQAKKALEQTLALAEQANRAKSDFLSAMSHDIRTPMNAIMGMTALARAHLDDRERVADCLGKISVSSRHLLSLINDILDMSKIERSKIALNRVRLSLPELLGQLADMVGPQAGAAGLALEVTGAGVAHPDFYGDGLRINQILINLLSNAIKFTPEGGRVALLAEELPAPEDRVRYRFSVRDTGVGMPPEFLARIFEPFTRSGSTQRVEGTGLGLSITKGLVELMGGCISVESEVGRGSLFRVELECERARPGGEAPAQTPVPNAGALFTGRRFLVAEDNAINAEILCELLWMEGAQCVVKGDGAQAVQAFASSPPGTYDAVLMDVQMPEMNGYQATRAIRALPRPDAAGIPIVAMTANAFAEDVQASVEAGMDAHVAKPIDMEVLRATLYRILGGAG